MQSQAATPDAYLNELPEDRRLVIEALRKVFKANLPDGFEEIMDYGMLGFVVPYDIYPKGYHCTPKKPLPFISIASQKNFIAIYHMGIYADEGILQWFQQAYAALEIGKLDMGKSCIRFKNMENIPYALLGELAQKITVEQWIEMYEKNHARSK